MKNLFTLKVVQRFRLYNLHHKQFLPISNSFRDILTWNGVLALERSTKGWKYRFFARIWFIGRNIKKFVYQKVDQRFKLYNLRYKQFLTHLQQFSRYLTWNGVPALERSATGWTFPFFARILFIRQNMKKLFTRKLFSVSSFIIYVINSFYTSLTVFEICRKMGVLALEWIQFWLITFLFSLICKRFF